MPRSLQTQLRTPIVSIALSTPHVYLIPCQEGYLQIDTGYEHDYSLYRRNLAKAGIALESIHYPLLTHHHDDHAGISELIHGAVVNHLRRQVKAGMLIVPLGSDWQSSSR